MLSSVRHYPRRTALRGALVTVTTASPARLDLMPGVEPTPLALLLLGRSSDPSSERGVDCPGDLPAASDPTLVTRARAAKEALGDRVFVLGHHYQRDEVIAFADVTGDSFKLAQQAAARLDEDDMRAAMTEVMAAHGERFPEVTAAMGESGGQNQAFSFGVDRILDGLEVLISRRL